MSQSRFSAWCLLLLSLGACSDEDGDSSVGAAGADSDTSNESPAGSNPSASASADAASEASIGDGALGGTDGAATSGGGASTSNGVMSSEPMTGDVSTTQGDTASSAAGSDETPNATDGSASDASSTSTASDESADDGAGGAPATTDNGSSSTAATGGSGTRGEDSMSGAGGSRPGSGGGGDPSGGTGGSVSSDPAGLLWPIDCVPDSTCLDIGFPDTDEDGVAFDCGEPGYAGHQGTDIPITWQQMDEGVDVCAAADGEVLFVFDGKYDRCPDETHPDCQDADYAPGSTEGNLACTELGPYCGTGNGSCYWCFAGGNVIVIRHDNVPGVFATRYDHLRQGSPLVEPGDVVVAGEVIAQVGSAGNSTGPHLHFEVWGTGFYELADPWLGECGPNTEQSLWASEPPWQ